MAIIISNSQPSENIENLAPLHQVMDVSKNDVKKSVKQGEVEPGENVIIYFPSFSLDPKYQRYTEFRLIVNQEGDFFSTSGLQSSQNVTSLADKIFSIDWDKTPLLDLGNYSGKIELTLIGINDAQISKLSTQTVEVNLEVQGAPTVGLSPSIFYVTHEKGTSPVWADNITVTTPLIWSVANSDEGNHSALLINGEPDQMMDFIGNQTLSLSLSNDVNELTPGHYLLELYFLANAEQAATAYINLFIVPDDSPVPIYPSSLEFFAIKNFLEADYQELYLFAINDSIDSIDGEPWIDQIEIIGVTDHMTILKVRPLNSNWLSKGIYQGKITINIGADAIQVNVKHTVVGDYHPDYIKPVHFTRDNDILTLYSQTEEETYIKLEGVIKARNYKGEESVYHREWSLPFHNDKAEINLGREVDNYLNIHHNPYQQINFSAQKLLPDYLPMSVKLTASEIRYADETAVRIFPLPFFYFLRGRAVSLANKFWLSHHANETVRVTPDSLIMLNIFKSGEHSPVIQMKRNGVFVKNITASITPTWQSSGQFHLLPGFMSYLFRLPTLTDLELGEKISFAYGNVQRDFRVIQRQKTSVHIGWINQFEVLDIFEFTGRIGLPMEYEAEMTTEMRDWQEVSRKLASSKVQNIVINTGWIFRSNVRIIDEIIDSKKAFWLKRTNPYLAVVSEINETSNFIELIPKGKKMTAYDSDRALYEFDVEFEIIRKHEDGIYLP